LNHMAAEDVRDETFADASPASRQRDGAFFAIRGLGTLPPVVPAPMAGYGDRAWREIIRRMGCRLVVVPMVSAEGLARGDRKTLGLLDIEGEIAPVVVQIFGSRPEGLAEAARRLESLGVSGVDLNFGCPARRVAAHGGGAAVLKNPALLADLVGAVRRAVALPLTVKMRAGWDESAPGVEELVRVAEGEGADAIALHARTGKQMFTGEADWDRIAEAKRAATVPIIGNGDIRSGEDALRMMRLTGCDAVMIGRAALGNPWLFAEALDRLGALGRSGESSRQPSPDERLEMMLEHARLAARWKGEVRGIVEFRKHAVCYVRGLRGAKHLRQALVSCSTLSEVERAVESYRRRAGGVIR